MTSTIAAGDQQIAAAGVDVVCLRREDVDGDGSGEWLGAYAGRGEPARLGAFVLDGDSWHELSSVAESKYGLGVHRTCHLESRDINVDGRTEVLVWGHARESTDLLHVFAWDGAAYSLIAYFEGNAGIRLEEADGMLGEDVVVGHRADEDLVWEVVYTWDGAAYGWTWDRHAWFFRDRPHLYDSSSPERAVISFYLALDDRDLPGAYGLLSTDAQAALPYDDWALGFSTTISVEASGVRELEMDDGTRASVSAQVLSRDNLGGRVLATLWDVVWEVVNGADDWRLEAATIRQLDQWELTYAK
jgi:hypothetical protein